MLTWPSFECVSCASHCSITGHAIIPLEQTAIVHALIMFLQDTNELRTTPRRLVNDSWSVSSGEVSDKVVSKLPERPRSQRNSMGCRAC